MMRWIIATSMKLQYLVIVLAIVMLVFGVNLLSEMPVDVFPEFAPPLVEVQTEALGLSAVEMEALITVPLEADLLNGVAWLDQIYSETVSGLSSILLVFEEGTDPIRARQMVQERLTQTFALPNVSSPPTMLQPLSSSSRILAVGLSSSEMSLIDMSVLARWNIKPRLMGVPGVANVAIWGQREWQLQVLVEPERLHANDVTLQQVIRTTGEALWVSPLSYLESSSPGTAGWIDTPNQRLGIQHLLPIASANELAKVAVVDHEGLLLGDVTEVVEDHQPLIGDAVLNDGPGLLLVIEKFPNANTLEVTRGVEEALGALAPGLKGIEIDTTVFRPANYVEAAIGNISNQTMIGVALGAIVLALFFFGWRSTLISLFVIPFSLITAALVLYQRGETFNVMFLAGLVMALGVIIDNVITDVENIRRRLRERNHGNNIEKAPTVILHALLEKRSPLFFAFLMIVLTMLPVLTVQGETGAFINPLVESYIIAVFVSLLTALVITPATCLILFGNASLRDADSPILQGLRSAYNGVLTNTVRTPNTVLIAAVVITIVGIIALVTLQLDPLPELKQTELSIQWDGAPGTSGIEMTRISTQFIQELQAVPGVQNVTSQIGRAITGDQIVATNSSDVWVSIDPSADYDATMAAIREITAGYPGMLRDVQPYQPERIGDVLTTQSQDIVVRVYGDNLDTLSEKASELSTVFSTIDGVSDVQVDRLISEPQVQIEVDLAAAERYQVKPGDVRRASTTLLSGLRVGNLYEGQKVFEVVVWAVPEVRKSLTDIENLLIDTPTGQVPLNELADIRIQPAPIVIKRDAVQRFTDVTVTVSGRDMGSVVTDLENGLQQVEFPLEYHAEILRATLNQQANQQVLMGITAAVVIGIFLLLQAVFNSWRLALFSVLLLPAALGGGAIALALGGGVLSVSAFFGFLCLVGLALRASILMISHMQHLELIEGETFGDTLVLRGANERFTPIIMSILAIGLTLIPFIFAGPVAGNEVIYPMALVILGGLITIWFVNLFVCPALYLRFGTSAATMTSNIPITAQPGPEMA